MGRWVNESHDGSWVAKWDPLPTLVQVPILYIRAKTNILIFEYSFEIIKQIFIWLQASMLTFQINFDKWVVNAYSSKRTNIRSFRKGSFVTFRIFVSALLYITMPWFCSKSTSFAAHRLGSPALIVKYIKTHSYSTIRYSQTMIPYLQSLFEMTLNYV